MFLSITVFTVFLIKWMLLSKQKKITNLNISVILQQFRVGRIKSDVFELVWVLIRNVFLHTGSQTNL